MQFCSRALVNLKSAWAITAGPCNRWLLKCLNLPPKYSCRFGSPWTERYAYAIRAWSSSRLDQRQRVVDDPATDFSVEDPVDHPPGKFAVVAVDSARHEAFRLRVE